MLMITISMTMAMVMTMMKRWGWWWLQCSSMEHDRHVQCRGSSNTTGLQQADKSPSFEQPVKVGPFTSNLVSIFPDPIRNFAILSSTTILASHTNHDHDFRNLGLLKEIHWNWPERLSHLLGYNGQQLLLQDCLYRWSGHDVMTIMTMIMMMMMLSMRIVIVCCSDTIQPLFNTRLSF